MNAGPAQVPASLQQLFNHRRWGFWIVAGSAAFWLGSLLAALGQPKNEQRPPPPLNPVEAKKQGEALAAELLAQVPEQNTTNSGSLIIRGADAKVRTIGLQLEVFITPTNWLSVYEADDSTNLPGGEKLVIVHTDGQPNVYLLSGDTNSVKKELAGNETMRPFAGSDFRVGDLGLEFLRWPQQRLLKKEMRRSRFCEVLESVNRHPGPEGYSRVVSWLDSESPHGIVHADAYDSGNELMEQFDPKKLEKVQGQWQPEELEIRNRKTGSRTIIEYHPPP